jgi:hypothetical protein
MAEPARAILARASSRHSAWLITVLNLLHVLGGAFVVGVIGVFDIKALRDRGRIDCRSAGR